MIHRAFKTELDPNVVQRQFFERGADAARFVWNWGLGRKQEVRMWNQLPTVQMKYPSGMDLHKELVRLKRSGPLAWLYDLPKSVAHQPLRDLDRAFANLFEHGYGWPKFKSKKWAKKSFHVNGENVVIANGAIRLPIIGWVRLKERGYLRSEGPAHPLYATVSERGGRWFVSVSTVTDDKPIPAPDDAPIVGIDRGLATLAVLSTGQTIESPKALHVNERQLRRLSRSVSRKRPGSKRRVRAVQRLARLHFKIANVRKDALHKATTELARAKQVYVVEDLSVRGMMGNRRLAKPIADAAWSEFVRQLEYKAAWYGSRVIKADRFFPSTKRCSQCGTVKTEMPLGVRTFRCECGLVIDRDLNAARNLQQWPTVRGTLETPAGDGTIGAADEAGIVVGG